MALPDRRTVVDNELGDPAQRFRNESRSRVKRSFAVANRPCGSPSYSSKVELAMPLAAARPAASIGTVLSAVPWMMSVGQRKAARSGRKSVVANAFAHASVAFRLAYIATVHEAWACSSLVGCETMPMP